MILLYVTLIFILQWSRNHPPAMGSHRIFAILMVNIYIFIINFSPKFSFFSFHGSWRAFENDFGQQRRAWRSDFALRNWWPAGSNSQHIFFFPLIRLKIAPIGFNFSTFFLWKISPLKGTSDWRFAGVLHRDPRRNTRVAECPELLRLRKSDASSPPLWLLNYGALDARDPLTGRRDLTPALVGTFDGARFDVLFEQELDFAAGAYAYQVKGTCWGRRKCRCTWENAEKCRIRGTGKAEYVVGRKKAEYPCANTL